MCVARPILFRPQTGSRSRLRVNGFPSEPYPLAATNGHVEVEVEARSSLELCDCYVVWSGCVCCPVVLFFPYNVDRLFADLFCLRVLVCFVVHLTVYS